jgi:putative hydrolase of HD superfamily
MAKDAESLASFAYELGLLKRVSRSGWWQAGIKEPESVADHSMRTAQLAALIAAEEGADPVRAAFLALWHDTQETRTGDLPHTAHAYIEKPDARQITLDQTAQLPDRSKETIRAAVDEYEALETLESHCAKDADKLEMIFQAIEYKDAGNHRTERWIESGLRALRTETGRKMAEAATRTSPLSWRER